MTEEKEVKDLKPKHYEFYCFVKYVVFINKLIGALPASTEKWDLHVDKPRVKFSFQKSGLVFRLMQFLVVLHMSYISCAYIQPADTLLFQVILLAMAATIRSIALNIYASIYGIMRIIQCLNKSLKMLMGIQSDLKNKVQWLYFMLYFIIFTGSFPIAIRCLGTSKCKDVASFTYSNLQEIGLICMMITIFAIIEASLEDINNAIKLNFVQEKFKHTKLEDLRTNHLQTLELIEETSHCFGFTIAVLCWYTLVKVVLLVYYSYFMFVTNAKVTKIEYLTTATDVPYRLFVIWYLGLQSDKIHFQKVETSRLVAELLVNSNIKVINEKFKEDIQIFLLQLRCKNSKFSACGLFELDRSKFYSILQMAVTYIVVLVQFHSFM